MSKIFIAEDGSKYEVVGGNRKDIPDVFIIKPLVEENQKYILVFGIEGVYKKQLHHLYDLTPDQAAKVSEAIEALMELLQTDKYTFNDFEDGRHNAWTVFAKAREALNEDN